MLDIGLLITSDVTELIDEDITSDKTSLNSFDKLMLILLEITKLMLSDNVFDNNSLISLEITELIFIEVIVDNVSESVVLIDEDNINDIGLLIFSLIDTEIEFDIN